MRKTIIGTLNFPSFRFFKIQINPKIVNTGKTRKAEFFVPRARKRDINADNKYIICLFFEYSNAYEMVIKINAATVRSPWDEYVWSKTTGIDSRIKAVIKDLVTENFKNLDILNTAEIATTNENH